MKEARNSGMLYLSSTTNIPEEHRDCFGIMFSAKHPVGGLNEALESGWCWMMDNNQFTGDFDAKTWLNALLRYLPHKDACLGIPVPDVVGNALETLRLFSQYWRVVRDLGYPVAFVSQDGITPEVAPWDYMDVLFVGGTDDHKLGSEAGMMIAEARHRGKWIHVGRVNSARRLRQFWMADSADGTGLIYAQYQRGDNGRDKRTLLSETKKLADAVLFCRHKKEGSVTPGGQYKLLKEMS